MMIRGRRAFGEGEACVCIYALEKGGFHRGVGARRASRRAVVISRGDDRSTDRWRREGRVGAIAAVFDDVLFSRSQWTDAYRVGVVLARPRRRIARAELKSSRMIKGTERRRRTWRSRIANV